MSQLFRALFALMHHACLRACEVSVSKISDHILRRQQIHIITCGQKTFMVLRFKSYKHSKSGKVSKIPKVSLESSDSKFCPIELYLAYDNLTPKNRVHAFVTPEGTPITRTLLSQTLRKCIQILGLEGFYDTHSFRIGITTDMAIQRYSEQQIANVRRWESDAYRIYIRPQVVNIPVMAWLAILLPLSWRASVPQGHSPWPSTQKSSS